MGNWYEYAESFADDYEEMIATEKEYLTAEDLEEAAAWLEMQSDREGWDVWGERREEE